METNKIYYLYNYYNFSIKNTKNVTQFIIDIIDKSSKACKLLMEPKIYKTKKADRKASFLDSMGLDKLQSIYYDIRKNWLSEVAKGNEHFVGGWMVLNYPSKVEYGGVTHEAHATGFSVCRDDPDKPKINICNTWGLDCTKGKNNPWGPQWDPKKILLNEVQIIQYFPPT